MKFSVFGILSAGLVMALQAPAHAYNWKMLAECHFIGADGTQLDETCRVEGSSNQGNEGFTINWKDGTQTRVSGSFVTGERYTVDQRPAVMRRVNDVTVLRTYSGNVIILHKVQELK